jgi:transcriptional regulator with XRE-family HTH domain
MFDAAVVIGKSPLLRAMHSKGISSLNELAARARVHRNTLNYLLSGRRSPISDSLLRFATVLEVDALTLLSRGGDKSAQDDKIEFIRSRLSGLVELYPNVVFLLIGSRARGKAQEFSDWDIAISAGKGGLSTEDYLKIKQSILSVFDSWQYSVDVVNLDQAPDWFLLDLDYLPMYLAGDRGNFHYFMGWLDGRRSRTKAA